MTRKLALILLAVLMLCGCQKKQEDRLFSVIVFASDRNDDAVAVFSDKQGNILHTSEHFAYPSDVCFGEDAVYYSSDNRSYHSIRYADYQPGEDLVTVSGRLVCYCPEGLRCEFGGGMLMFFIRDELLFSHNAGNILTVSQRNGKLYLVDNANTVFIHDGRSGKLLNTIPRPFAQVSDFAGITYIKDKTYLISETGYTEITSDNQAGTTYLYPLSFSEIEGAEGKYVAVVIDGEDAVFEVSFDASRMTMTEVYDDFFLENRDFAREYPELYEQGYEAYYVEEFIDEL